LQFARWPKQSNRVFEQEEVIRQRVQESLRVALLMSLATFIGAAPLAAQQEAPSQPGSQKQAGEGSYQQTTQDYNKRIAEMARDTRSQDLSSPLQDYQIGPEDLLEISVLEAPDLNRTTRVADDGTISLALLGAVPAAGSSTRELQADLEDRLRQTYMNDPQVSVFVQEMRSHPVSVFGAVQKPGVYQIRRAKTLVEVLSMAQGLADDAGDTIIISRNPSDKANANAAVTALLKSNASSTATSSELALSAQGTTASAKDQNTPPQSITVNLKDLLDSGNSRSDVLVYPGDVVKVSRAGVVYVVGQVNKPGGFLLKTNENISALQAIALAEGMGPYAKGKDARIFVASAANGSPREITINLDKVLAGKEAAPFLKPNDVLFVPTSTSKEALRSFQQSTFGIAGALGGAAIYRW
jgi:polysaccharide biosynthesis/export protein